MQTPSKPFRTAGIHHITAISGPALETHRFYTEVLGLRLVKKTVNFDDPGTYHLYYGDETGNPGTLITFFPWEGMSRGRNGTGEISAIAFRIPEGAIGFWRGRLQAEGIPAHGVERFGEPVLRFKDPHGLRLELAGTEAAAQEPPWREGPVPERHAVRGFHSATATLESASETEGILGTLLGMEPAGREGNRIRFRAAGTEGPGRFYDLLLEPGLGRANLGVGSVHHIAFRAADDDQQQVWRSLIEGSGLQVTPVINRKYFRSIYFREGGGVLFEIATDPPGFTVDETLESLGAGLMLPAPYEHLRPEIERLLPDLSMESESLAS